MATMPVPTPQIHGVFAAFRSTCDGSRGGSWAPLCGITMVGALPMPDVPPICVWAADGITTVAELSGAVTPLDAGDIPWRDPESRRRRLRSAPRSAAVW